MTTAALAHVVRSGFVEGVHAGSAVVLDAAGAVVLEVGEPQAPVFPRSAAKPLQTVGMLNAGLRLEPELLALATASHSGQPVHIAGVQRILQQAGLGVDALDNTPDLPLGRAERRAAQQRRDTPSSLTQNCSGQHAAMLLTCVGNGWPLTGYLRAEHPLQVTVAAAVRDLTGDGIAAVGVDGCGAPTLAVSLTALARAFSAISVAGAALREGQVAAAVRGFPEILGGDGREVTRLMQASPGLLAKDGAESVFAAAMPDGSALAVKVSDGAPRAVWPVAVALLRRLGLAGEVLDELARVDVLGHGRVVGSVQAVI